MIMPVSTLTSAAPVLPSTYPTIAARNSAFVRLLPVIRRNARLRLRHLRAAEREEAEQEIVANAFVAFTRLVARRQGHRAYATPLANFAIKGYRMGRRVAARLNRNDVTSHYCRVHRGVTVRSLQRWDDETQAWEEILVEDRRFPPAETAAARIDFAEWLASLPRRNRRLAMLLAMGESTLSVARRFRVTPGRVSQLRREFHDGWHEFVGDRVEAPGMSMDADNALQHGARDGLRGQRCGHRSDAVTAGAVS